MTHRPALMVNRAMEGDFVIEDSRHISEAMAA